MLNVSMSTIQRVTNSSGNWVNNYLHDDNYLQEVHGPFGNGSDELRYSHADGTLDRGGQIFWGTMGFLPAIATGGAAYEAGGATLFIASTNAVSSADMLVQGMGGLDKTPLTMAARRIGGEKGEKAYVVYNGVINTLGVLYSGWGVLLHPDPSAAINAASTLGTGASAAAAYSDYKTISPNK